MTTDNGKTGPGSALDESRWVKVSDLCRLTSLSRRTVFRLLAQGRIPEPVRLGPRLLRWRARDVEKFLEQGAET